MQRTVLQIVGILGFSALLTGKVFAANDPMWGRIANPGYEGQYTRGILFFPGPHNPVTLSWYSRHPVNFDQFYWRTDEDVRALFDQMTAVGVNVIKLSWWGENTCALNSSGDWECRYSPTVNAPPYNHQTFTEAKRHNILVAPMLEVSVEEFPFFSEYPDNLANFKARILAVLRDYGTHENWLSLYDKNGTPRRVIWLIETISINPAVAEDVFAENFDVLADQIFRETGYKIGFIIDPTPLPPSSGWWGPNPQYLQNTQSLLAINPFNITSDGTTEEQRIAGARDILLNWTGTGFPIMTPILPAHDDSSIPWRTEHQVYGDNPWWREQVLELAKTYQTVGITLDVWNGFTEGYVFVPTEEVPEANYALAKNAFDYIRSLEVTGTPTHAPKPADANGDGNVDGLDYSIWVSHYTQRVSGPSEGDFNGDTVVDGLDYVIWVSHYQL